jgi:hypothetical protein
MLFLRALTGLLVYDVLNAFCRFETLYSMVKVWKIAELSNRAIDDITKTIDYACIWYPKEALCLQRSFVTTYLLRKYGFPAEMVLGAQKLPFKAHAWVEVAGRSVNERGDVRSRYTVWDRC